MPEHPRAAILTREAGRNAALRSLLEANAVQVIEVPCVKTEPADQAALARALGALTDADLLVVTSTAGVAAIAAARGPSEIRADIAAVGPATAADARAAGLRVRFVATRPDGATLGAELPLPRGDVVLARSDSAGADLPRILRARGARVREIVAYRTVAGASGDLGGAAAAIDAGAAVVLASPSAVEGLLGAFSRESLRKTTLVAIGPTTAGAIRGRIGTEPVVASGPAPEEILAAVLGALRPEVLA